MSQAAPNGQKPPVKERSIASDVNLSFFGIMNLSVDLFPTKETPRSEFSLACPVCAEPTKLKQQYVCEKDPSHGPFQSGDAARVKEIDGVLYPVTADEVADLKAATLPPKDAKVSVFPAPQVEERTRPTGNAYRVKPKVSSALPVYAMIRDLVQNPAYAFVLELTLRGTQKMYRVETWAGHLVLQELARPEETRSADPIESTYDSKLLATAKTLAETQIEEFDPETFRSAVKQRIAEFAEQKKTEGGGTPTKKPTPASGKSGEDDLLATLEAAIAAAKQTKASA